MNDIDPINYLFVMAEYVEEKYVKVAEATNGLVVTAAKKKPSGIATKTNPALWSRCKSEAKSRMGGKHSARAMQLAVKLYKQRGGGFRGGKPTAKTNKMKKWTKQKWMYLKDYKKKDKNKLDDNSMDDYADDYTNYVNDDISFLDENDIGRYLPEAKWRSLSKSEREATDKKKKQEGKDKQYVPNTEKAKVKSKAKYY
jgi:hypothetical protein